MPPLVIHQDGGFLDIPVNESLPLGVMRHVPIDHQEFTIPTEGLALMYSDGLHEALNAHNRIFGLDQVKQKLLTNHLESAETICEKLWLAVQEHRGEVPHQDDFTTVIVKRN